MKTIVIWDDTEANIRFFVVPFDCSHLNGKYVNSDASDSEASEITEMTQDEEGHSRYMLEEFPIDELYETADDGHICRACDVKVITCGFLP